MEGASGVVAKTFAQSLKSMLMSAIVIVITSLVSYYISSLLPLDDFNPLGPSPPKPYKEVGARAS